LCGYDTPQEKNVDRGYLRTGYGQKEEKVTKGWRELHNEELHKFYFSPNIIRMIKPKLMG
jgi:hypothetical protein